MKKLALLIILTGILISCNRYSFKTDDVIRFFKSESYDIEAKYLSFCEIPTYDNAVNQYVNNQKDMLIKYADDYANDNSEFDINYKYELRITDTVFMANNLFISTRFCNYSYTGGAHGNTTFKSFNYDVTSNKLLSDEEILDFSDSTLINNLLIKYFDDEGCFSEKPSLDKKYTLNVSTKAVTFMFWQYELGAYACGYKEVTIPMDEALEFLKIKTYNGKVVITLKS